MAQKTLDNLFLETLKDVYHAEKTILKGLKKMAKGAQSDELGKAFEKHREETQTHVERLEEIFGMLDRAPRAKTCEAVVGLMQESEEILDDFKNSEALDAGLVAAAQAVEHYEIARYGALRTWARRLGMNDAASLLEKTLEEEKKTDALLNEIATSQANSKAA